MDIPVEKPHAAGPTKMALDGVVSADGSPSTEAFTDTSFSRTASSGGVHQAGAMAKRRLGEMAAAIEDKTTQRVVGAEQRSGACRAEKIRVEANRTQLQASGDGLAAAIEVNPNLWPVSPGGGRVLPVQINRTPVLLGQNGELWLEKCGFVLSVWARTSVQASVVALSMTSTGLLFLFVFYASGAHLSPAGLGWADVVLIPFAIAVLGALWYGVFGLVFGGPFRVPRWIWKHFIVKEALSPRIDSDCATLAALAAEALEGAGLPVPPGLRSSDKRKAFLEIYR